MAETLTEKELERGQQILQEMNHKMREQNVHYSFDSYDEFPKRAVVYLLSPLIIAGIIIFLAFQVEGIAQTTLQIGVTLLKILVSVSGETLLSFLLFVGSFLLSVLLIMLVLSIPVLFYIRWYSGTPTTRYLLIEFSQGEGEMSEEERRRIGTEFVGLFLEYLHSMGILNDQEKNKPQLNVSVQRVLNYGLIIFEGTVKNVKNVVDFITLEIWRHLTQEEQISSGGEYVTTGVSEGEETEILIEEEGEDDLRRGGQGTAKLNWIVHGNTISNNRQSWRDWVIEQAFKGFYVTPFFLFMLLDWEHLLLIGITVPISLFLLSKIHLWKYKELKLRVYQSQLDNSRITWYIRIFRFLERYGEVDYRLISQKINSDLRVEVFTMLGAFNSSYFWSRGNEVLQFKFLVRRERYYAFREELLKYLGQYSTLPSTEDLYKEIEEDVEEDKLTRELWSTARVRRGFWINYGLFMLVIILSIGTLMMSAPGPHITQLYDGERETWSFSATNGTEILSYTSDSTGVIRLVYELYNETGQHLKFDITVVRDGQILYSRLGDGWYSGDTAHISLESFFFLLENENLTILISSRTPIVVRLFSGYRHDYSNFLSPIVVTMWALFFVISFMVMKEYSTGEFSGMFEDYLRLCEKHADKTNSDVRHVLVHLFFYAIYLLMLSTINSALATNGYVPSLLIQYLDYTRIGMFYTYIYLFVALAPLKFLRMPNKMGLKEQWTVGGILWLILLGFSTLSFSGFGEYFVYYFFSEGLY